MKIYNVNNIDHKKGKIHKLSFGLKTKTKIREGKISFTFTFTICHRRPNQSWNKYTKIGDNFSFFDTKKKLIII
jgi:hypothetical protein